MSIPQAAFHEQSWCEMCQDADRPCFGDHSSAPVSTPLVGTLWRDTDHGAEFPRMDVFSAWCEFEDHCVPQVYVGACSPGQEGQKPDMVTGYLDLVMAERLRDSLTEAIDNIRLTLGGNHHLLCDCRGQHEGDD